MVRRPGFEFWLHIFQLYFISLNISFLIHNMILAVPWAQGKTPDSFRHCLPSRFMLSPRFLLMWLCAMEEARMGELRERQVSSVNIVRQGAMWVHSKAKQYGALAKPSKGRLEGVN